MDEDPIFHLDEDHAMNANLKKCVPNSATTSKNQNNQNEYSLLKLKKNLRADKQRSNSPLPLGQHILCEKKYVMKNHRFSSTIVYQKFLFRYHYKKVMVLI